MVMLLIMKPGLLIYILGVGKYNSSFTSALNWLTEVGVLSRSHGEKYVNSG